MIVDPAGASNVHRSKTILDLWQKEGQSVSLGAWEQVDLCQHLSLRDLLLPSSGHQNKLNKLLFTSKFFKH